MTEYLLDFLNCPSCRSKLSYNNNILSCYECKQIVSKQSRLLDFYYLTPNLPLELMQYSQRLHENAAQTMHDIKPDFRVNSVLKEITQNVQGSVCLEIGGADGPMTPKLEKLFDTVFTLDFSRSFLERIELKTKKAICLLGDAHFLPIQDGVIDNVICSEVLEHVTIPTQLLSEIRRVMKKDAICILSVPNEFSLLPRRNMKLKHLPAHDTHINFYTPDSLAKLAFRTGFLVVKNMTLSPPMPSIKEILRHPFSFIKQRIYGTYILCLLKTMVNPHVYWESFSDQYIKKSSS